MTQITCASPAYLHKYGEPKSLADLSQHRAVNYVSRTTAKLFPFEFVVDGELKEVAVDGALSVFGAEIYAASAIAGLGIIQCPHYRMETQITQGLVKEILSDLPPPPMPVSVLYPHNRHMSPHVATGTGVCGLVERDIRQGVVRLNANEVSGSRPKTVFGERQQSVQSMYKHSRSAETLQRRGKPLSDVDCGFLAHVDIHIFCIFLGITV